MAYVDLNPVRANIAETPETSDHTSFKERLRPTINIENATKEHLVNGLISDLPSGLKPLLDFEGSLKSEQQNGILFCLKDYLELVDYTGRILRDDKKGAISNSLPPILERLDLNSLQWIKQCCEFEAVYERQFRRRRIAAKKQAA